MNGDDLQYLDDREYSIKDIVDLVRLSEVFKKFARVTGYNVSLFEYPSQDMLFTTDFRDICANYHRVCPGSFEKCVTGNMELAGELKTPGARIIKECLNGLTGCAVPVVVRGKRVASLVAGQVLTGQPNLERFRKQARLYGYDMDEYLEALCGVPVVSEDNLNDAALYLSEFAAFIGEMGYRSLEARRSLSILAREVARREKAEGELRESQEYAKVLFSSSRVPMIVMDAQTGVYIDCNEAAVRVYGYEGREEVIGKTPLDVSAPLQYDGSGSAEEVWRHIRACQEKGSHTFEWCHQRPDGIIWDAAVHLMLFHHRGRPLIQFTLQDITDRKRTEAALRASEEALRSLFNATDEALFLIDTGGTILMGNEVLARRIGKSIGELIGTCQYEHFPPDVATSRRKQYDKVINTGKPVHFEDERAGMTFRISAYPVFDEERKVVKIAVFVVDITERKRAEAEREGFINDLREALSKIKTLRGFLPICSSCKKIRNDKGYWEQIEVYIRDNSDAEFSHSLCPDCVSRLYPDLFKDESG